jgi:hypothetical protein
MFRKTPPPPKKRGNKEYRGGKGKRMESKRVKCMQNKATKPKNARRAINNDSSTEGQNIITGVERFLMENIGTVHYMLVNFRRGYVM